MDRNPLNNNWYLPQRCLITTRTSDGLDEEEAVEVETRESSPADNAAQFRLFIHFDGLWFSFLDQTFVLLACKDEVEHSLPGEPLRVYIRSVY